MFEFTKVDVINNVLVFSTLRDRLVSRRRQEAPPALVGLVLGYLDDNRVFRKIGKYVVEEACAGDFSMMASWNSAGRYLRIDRDGELVFSGYWKPQEGCDAMTWRRHPSWEAHLYDAMRTKGWRLKK